MATSSNTTLYVPTIFGENVFKLRHKNYPIFAKKFDSANVLVVDIVNDKIKIPEHFFVTGEKLYYKYPDEPSRIAISTSSPGNTLGTSFLPDEVYPIVLDGQNIKLAFTKDLAEQNQYIDIVGVGVGNTHQFVCDKKNTKCLITIDNIIQSPVSNGKTVQIVDIVNSNSLQLESLDDIYQGTILNISGEYAKVSSIIYGNDVSGIGTVKLLRSKSILGTDPKIWDNTTTYVNIVSGQYNIVDDTIYFTSNPFEGSSLNFSISPDDFDNENKSVSLFSQQVKTGSAVRLVSQNPPKGLDAGKLYYMIQNFPNNFSFAETFSNANDGIKIDFDSTTGQYDQLSPVTNTTLSLLGGSGASSFYGRVFLRSNYDGNLIFDDISGQFDGITDTFTITESGVSTTGISQDNGIVLINNIFQYPEFEESFIYEEDVNSGISSIRFIGIGTDGDPPKSYDVNVKGYPRGGIIAGYGLSGGTNYQPLKPAKLYQTFSIDGGNSDYIINNTNVGIAYSGSGYRDSSEYSASITFEQNGIKIVGYGTGIVQNGNIISVDIIEPCVYENDVPDIIIEPPLNYTNMPLTGSPNGIGAKASLVISDDGEVQNFKITNFGYGYNSGEILSIPNIVGNATQISSEELKVLVLSVNRDTFSAWNLGKLRKLDDLSAFTNGVTKTFNLLENGDLVSIESLPGSPIDLAECILLFVNDVLQIPSESYTFEGGTQIILSEAPPPGSNVKVYLYEGSPGDTVYTDVVPKIKIGDSLVVKNEITRYPETQLNRTVKKIISSDRLNTEIYKKKGLSYNSYTYRPTDLIPQKQDLVIGGEIISKSRESLNSLCTSYSLVAYELGTFNDSGISTVAISTTGIQLGDYLESPYTEHYEVISISEGVIGFSGVSTNESASTVQFSVWRKV